MKGTMRISEFAEKVGLHPQTIRGMIKRGEIKPLITPSGQYRFTEEHVRQVLGIEEKPKGKVVIYARVSTQKQKSYLDSQVEVCKQFLASKGMQIDEVITDIASSFNFRRKGLNKLLGMAFNGKIKTVCIYSKDRLSRIAYDLFEQILKRLGVEILIVDNSENLTTDEQLKDAVEEMISFIHYVTSKIYGSRSYKKKKIEKCIKEVVNAPDDEHNNQ